MLIKQTLTLGIIVLMSGCGTSTSTITSSVNGKIVKVQSTGGSSNYSAVTITNGECTIVTAIDGKEQKDSCD